MVSFSDPVMQEFIVYVQAKKEAVTDGMKRALRNFGNLLGLCLYEKSFAQEVVKIKAPPPVSTVVPLHPKS